MEKKTFNTGERQYRRVYEPLLPEYYPIKLIGAFISLDFIVGCAFNCSFCISKRHPSRKELFERGLVIDNRVAPEKMYHWLKSLPSYQAGVQIRIGHDTDAGLEFEKSSQLIDLIDNEHSITYLTRKPLNENERDFFAKYRSNLLLKLTTTPRSKSLSITRDPLDLVHSAEPIDNKMLYWVVGPLVNDNQEDTERILKTLPKGSRLFLKNLNYYGLPHLDQVKPLAEQDYKRFEQVALDQGHIVTEWFCDSLARVNKGFFDVDKIEQQPDSPKKEREIAYCKSCSSYPICYTPLDVKGFRDQLDKHLEFLGLHLIDEPRRTGNRSFEIKVAEPSSRGEETYLNHVINPPVSININTREQGRSQGGSFCNIDGEVLKRWYQNGFFPVTELNNVAENVLDDIRRIFGKRGYIPKTFSDNGGLALECKKCK
ncbi:hypothetical protein FJZ19_01495 [Candidatus Pacearchaeota archaeon]|nr:hypothetical protein [Candidatus Pacearchaeota archaeon]